MESHLLWQQWEPGSAGETLRRDLGKGELGPPARRVEGDQNELAFFAALDDLAGPSRWRRGETRQRHVTLHAPDVDHGPMGHERGHRALDRRADGVLGNE